MAEYQMNFNQDFTSISVLGENALRMFSISSHHDTIDEIFFKDNDNIRFVERLFNSSLLVLVTTQKPNCVKLVHFKKKQDICNCVYPTEILCIRMNRTRLVVCLLESIYIHDIRDMKILKIIEHIIPNQTGVIALSFNSTLAYPINNSSGLLQIMNASKLRPGLIIKAHESALSAMAFSQNGNLLATASERGTLIRVFCVKNGQRVHEFRRSMLRSVRIASLLFSPKSEFLCTSSNKETIHIFKIDEKAVCEAESKPIYEENENNSQINQPASSKAEGAVNTTTESKPLEASVLAPSSEEASTGGWGDYFSNVTSYLMPTQMTEVLYQERAFATVTLNQHGQRHVCGLTSVLGKHKLLVGSSDGFLYEYEINADVGGQCKMLRVHDLRCALEDMEELNITTSMENITRSSRSDITEKIEATEKTNNSVVEYAVKTSDVSYAGILRGNGCKDLLTESTKCRKLCDAIDTPTKLYDERQFPPVAIAAKD